ncbi:MAG: hypothetical protein JWM34_2789 [Ilumatobacteraceae bacterium]|nr:hypothetical protein [Ilumatobacteraceae bacterium]
MSYSTTPTRPRGAVARLLAVLAVVALTVAAIVMRAGATSQWVDGAAKQSDIGNCVTGQSEKGAAAWTGSINLPSTSEPYPGEVYYLHTIVYGQGNSCAGQYANVELTLPPNTSLAISTSNPVKCWAIAPSTTTADQGDCPQTLTSGVTGGVYRIPSPVTGTFAKLWPLPQGYGWEFQVPVVSSVPFALSGGVAGYTKVLDGWSSPVLQPTGPVQVYARAPQISSTSTTNFASANWPSTMLTTQYVSPYGVAGGAYFDMLTGSGGSVAYSDGPENFAAGTTGAVGVTEDWVISGHPLVANHTYYWHMRYVTSAGTYTGAQQSFTTPPTTGGTTTSSTTTTTTTPPTIPGGGGSSGGTVPPTSPTSPSTSTSTSATSATTASTSGGGTGSTAPAPAVASYSPIVPGRILDTRTGAGFSTVDGDGLGHGEVGANQTIELQVAGRAGVPADASAVVLNVTVTGAEGNGYVTVYPCGSPQPTTSNLNFTVGQTIPNAVISKIGDGGKVCLFANVATQLLADVGGYFPAGASYSPIVPARILDTRQGAAYSTVDGVALGQGLLGANQTIELQVAGRAGVPGDASAAVLNVTVTGAQGNGYVTVYPCGSSQPTTSNLNFTEGQTIPNAVISKIGDGGKVCIFANVGTHVLADVNGYFPAGSSYTPIVPGRILDTRIGPDFSTVDGLGLGQGLLEANQTLVLQVTGRAGVPASASAAVLNVTVTGAQGNGYVTVYPCGSPQPTTSNLNFSVGQTIPNAVLAKIGDGGTVCIFANVGTQVLADVNGYVPA